MVKRVDEVNLEYADSTLEDYIQAGGGHGGSRVHDAKQRDTSSTRCTCSLPGVSIMVADNRQGTRALSSYHHPHESVLGAEQVRPIHALDQKGRIRGFTAGESLANPQL